MKGIGKFADENKLEGKAVTKQNLDQIQNNIHKIERGPKVADKVQCREMQGSASRWSNHRCDYHMVEQTLY